MTGIPFPPRYERANSESVAFAGEILPVSALIANFCALRHNPIYGGEAPCPAPIAVSLRLAFMLDSCGTTTELPRSDNGTEGEEIY